MAGGITIVQVLVREPVEGLGAVVTLEQPKDGEVTYTDAGVLVSFRDPVANARLGRPAAQIRSSVLVPYWNVLAVRREFR